MEKIPCPLCLHEENMKARWRGRTAEVDEPHMMVFVQPARFAGTNVRPEGFWECQICRCRLPAYHAGVFLDAVLMHYDPNCDSITGKPPLHADVRRAMEGGR